MSIMVRVPNASQARANGAPIAPSLEPALLPLLDHIAAELAEEYVRLMEAAAAAGSTAAHHNEATTVGDPAR